MSLFLKFKRFWTSLVLVFCMTGLMAPANLRAQGEDISLDALATYGGTAAAVVGFAVLAKMLYDQNFLWKVESDAEDLISERQEENLSIEKWISRETVTLPNGEEKYVTDAGRLSVAINNPPHEQDARIDKKLDSAIRNNLFKKSFLDARGAINYPAFMEEIKKEITELKGMLSRIESCYSEPSMAGLSIEKRFSNRGKAKDWLYQSYVACCRSARLTDVVDDKHTPTKPENWSMDNYARLEKKIFGDATAQQAEDRIGYVGTISFCFPVTKYAIKVWWTYFKKIHLLMRLSDFVKILNAERSRQAGATNQQLDLTQQQHLANAGVGFVGSAHNMPQAHVAVPGQPVAQQAQPAQPQQPSSWKNWLLNKWTLGAGASVLAAAGLYKIFAR